jgi:uncharacterized membrane protein YdjX (TVP38/TMEM64 family)
MKKIIIVALLAVGLFAFWQSGLGDQLTLANLKARQAEFDTLFRAHPVAVLGGFFLIYVAVTALSLPGAAIMTLAAGALFGLVTGTILVSFASTIGATFAFLASRYLLRDTIKKRFGDRLHAIDEGIARDGAFYLLTLRLVPLFPFFLINLLMGLTPIRTWTYYWVSQIGMLLGTLVYVNAGTQLATIKEMGDIASPLLLGSFVALGILPWVARWLVKQLGLNAVSG